jgi:hypothetical protein
MKKVLKLNLLGEEIFQGSRPHGSSHYFKNQVFSRF